MNSISIGEEIDFSVEKTTERRMLEDEPPVEVLLSQQNTTAPNAPVVQNQTAS
jgi:hypothetical protein